MPYTIPEFENYILYDNLDVFSKTSGRFLSAEVVTLCNGKTRKHFTRNSLKKYIPIDDKYIKIPGFNGEYGISKDGEVYSFKTFRVLKSYPNKYRRGYVYIILSLNGKPKTCKVHRLVALTYIPNPSGKECVNHINGNVQDNSVDNLEWCTVKENNLWNVSRGVANGGNHKKCYLYTKSGEFVGSFRSIRKASEYVKSIGCSGYDDIRKLKYNKYYTLEVR
jgi:hypothetical protein